MDEEQEEHEISIQLANENVRKKLREAQKAVEASDWDKAHDACDDAEDMLTAYSYGYPDPTGLRKHINDAQVAIKKQDAAKAKAALQAALDAAKKSDEADEEETKRKQSAVTPDPNPEARTLLAADASLERDGDQYLVTIIDAGNGNGFVWGQEALRAGAHLFHGITAFVNHERRDVYSQRPGGRVVQDVCGVYFDPYFDETRQAIRARLRPTAPLGEWTARMINAIIRDREANLPVPNIGISADVSFNHKDGKVTRLIAAHSADIVFNPARGPQAGEAFARIANQVQKELSHMTQQNTPTQVPEPPVTPPAASQLPLAQVAQPPQSGPEAWIDFLREQGTQAALVNSNLPASLQQAVREELATQIVTPNTVNQAIARYQKLWAKMQEDEVIRGVGRPIGDIRIHGMRSPHEDLQNAVNWMFGLQDAQLPPPSLRRVDNIYMVITGDWDWHGVFRPEQAQLAAADSATLTGMAVNAMNKVIVNMWPGLEMYRWFEQLVTVQPHDGSTQNMQWIQFGGISNLDTVSEGGAYTEKTVDDSKEADAFTKYGNYVGITLEMIRRSDIAKMQAIPKALAIAAVRTRSTAIAGIFTANSGVGPTLDQDSVALFHTASHGNLATTAFSWTAWKAARIECGKQTELGSSKRQGLWPKYGLFPIDLYDDALVTFGYGQGSGGKPSTADNDVNPFAVDKPGDPRPTAVPVPDWTDTDNWAYLVDPKLHPVIQMSYAQASQGGAHPQPELFSVASPDSGLMFTNDVMPIKIRDWFAYGVATYRGIGKRNV